MRLVILKNDIGMRKLKVLFIVGLALLVGMAEPVFAQSKQEKKEQKEKELRELLDSGNFKIEVDRALPLNGSAVNLTSSYSLEMRGDSVISFLPYFGRAYSVPYGGGDGLRFSQQVTGKTVEFDHKGTAQIRFETRTDEDSFTYDIKIFSNGSSTIFVQPVNRQSITFHGDVNIPKED